MNCAKCGKAILTESDFIQVPLGIANPELMDNVFNGEPVPFHKDCSPVIEVWRG